MAKNPIFPYVKLFNDTKKKYIITRKFLSEKTNDTDLNLKEKYLEVYNKEVECHNELKKFKDNIKEYFSVSKLKSNIEAENIFYKNEVNHIIHSLDNISGNLEKKLNLFLSETLLYQTMRILEYHKPKT